MSAAENMITIAARRAHQQDFALRAPFARQEGILPSDFMWFDYVTGAGPVAIGLSVNK